MLVSFALKILPSNQAIFTEPGVDLFWEKNEENLKVSINARNNPFLIRSLFMLQGMVFGGDFRVIFYYKYIALPGI
jgi:hypothetical protein